MKNKPASLLVLSLGKALSRISHLGVVDRWLATPKQALIAHCLLSRDRSIDMLLNITKKVIQNQTFYVTEMIMGLMVVKLRALLDFLRERMNLEVNFALKSEVLAV